MSFSIFEKMKLFKEITIYIMSLLYVIGGVKHFTNTDFFVAIVPPVISWKEEAVLMLCAQFFHFRAKNNWVKFLPSLFLLILSLFIASSYFNY